MDKVVLAAKKAVEFDQKGIKEPAAYYYREAARLLLEMVNCDDDSFNADEVNSLNLKSQEYNDRAKQLDLLRLCEQGKETENEKTIQVLENQKLQRCRFLSLQALDADESGLTDDAINLYLQAVELSLQVKNEISDGDIKSKLSNLASDALDRAEQLKGIKNIDKKMYLTNIKEDDNSHSSNRSNVSKSVVPTGTIRPEKRTLYRGSSAHLQVSGNTSYTEEEKRVLLATSCINKNEFVPFMSVDLKEKFVYPLPFTDKKGMLELSPKQKRYFSHWARPEELCSEPKMLSGQHVGCYSIKQTIVSDCSFVASLAVSALYENRFGKRLVTSIIYPRNRNDEPVYNPFGKYMVKLHLNGVPRKVIIDDYLPIGKQGEMLCSYSTNRNEFWISLLEKAYMKVMGGYDFPGSNSNIDLHALTGWIPERIAMNNPKQSENRDSLFNMLFTRLHKGDVLITTATGPMSAIEEERTGLVSAHAYALLDARKVNNVQLVKLKNPWSHVRWRGNYSELDTKNWTKELQAALDFDPNSAAMFDNGVFWMDYDSLLTFFDVLYLNWNPKLFTHTFCIHQSWEAGLGPVKDIYNMGDNPQFRLEVDSADGGAVWILLTRHITRIDDFRENTEYITVLVYKNDGQRVYYPNDPPPYIDGIRINSPHYLCKIILDKNSARKYTLVVSQYEKMHTIYYTLRAYATCPFKLMKIINQYKYVKKISNGQWKGITAGGCRNHPFTYPNNPHYKLTLDNINDNSSVLIDLKGPKQYQMGIEVTPLSLCDPSKTAPFLNKSSGTYRSGFVVLELEDLPGGSYSVVPSTYKPQEEGPFFLTVKSSCPIQLTLEENR